MFDEDSMIRQLQAESEGFIGDDAALLPPLHASQYVITKDLLVENIHFRTHYCSPKDLAHKALHVNLSDLAAMGSDPCYVLCGIAVPDHLHEYSSKFLNYFSKNCKKEGVILIGGDTTASQDHLVISITAMGLTHDNRIKYRHTANTGDLVCVAGSLGCAHQGWMALENGENTETNHTHSFLRPQAKIKEGLWLGKQVAVTSMMDISDGLYIDLKRLCVSSNKGALMDIDLLQRCLGWDISVKVALEGGEDYGLLMTVHRNSWKKLSHEFARDFGYDLKVVGHIVDGNGISFKKDNQIVDLVIDSFKHFGEK